MNKIFLMGRTTNDAETRYTTDQKAVASFNFAVNRTFDRENSDFFKCVAFGKTAETIEKLVKKGTKLLLEGEIRNNNYTDKNGVKRYEMQVIVNSFEFCESKGQATTGAGTQPQADKDGFMSIPDGIEEELPFN
jgi:single-strand DNA-binding protein